MTFSICNFITIFGLSMDILGAWYLSRGLMRKSEEDLTKETGFCYGPNDNYIIGGLSQKVEGNVGFYCLLFGFCLQGLATLISDATLVKNLPTKWICIFATICILLFAIIFFISNFYIKKKKHSYIRAHVGRRVKEHINAVEDRPFHILDMRRHLGYLNVSSNEDESPEEIWEKLKQRVI